MLLFLVCRNRIPKLVTCLLRNRAVNSISAGRDTDAIFTERVETGRMGRTRNPSLLLFIFWLIRPVVMSYVHHSIVHLPRPSFSIGWTRRSGLLDKFGALPRSRCTWESSSTPPIRVGSSKRSPDTTSFYRSVV